MELDLLSSGIIGALVASAITLLGGFYLEHWRESKRIDREENQKIERMYVEEGLEPVISDISRYGTACTTTIIYVMRNLKAHSEDLKGFLNAVRQRQSVSDLIGYDYAMASRAFPRLMVFGKNFEIFDAVVNGFHTWSLFTQDLVDYERAQEWLRHEAEREE